MEKLSHILLVDDDEIANHLHKLLIQGMDIAEHIHIANEGDEAYEIIVTKLSGRNNHKNDALVIMDINMPGMDVFDLLEKYANEHKKKFPNIHFALLSNTLNLSDKSRAEAHAIDGFLDKPLTEQKLLELIDKIRSKSVELPQKRTV